MRLIFGVAILLSATASAKDVRVLFDPLSPSVGPFPTDALTVPDAAQITGRRVNMPLPDCAAEPSTCAEWTAVNQLDGFSIRPRIRVRFSGPVDPRTLKSGIFLVPMNDLARPSEPMRFGDPISINTVMYDPATNTAYAEPDQVLAEHSRCALVVTSAIRDMNGDPVEADPAFAAFRWQPGPYADEAWSALFPLEFTRRFAPDWIVAGSVFTTLSATAWMEKARAAIQTSSTGFRTNAPQAVFPVSELASITLHAQTGLNPPRFRDYATWPPDGLAGVDRIAFGSYRSPQFLADGLIIPNSPTEASVQLPGTSAEIFFHAYLPAGPAPPQGYPVVIVGHGYPDGRFRQPPSIASALASAGFASIAIDAAGHGYGPQSTLILTRKTGESVELAAGGRGIDLDGNGVLDQGEGCIVPAGPQVVVNRDCLRQTALDLMQLVRVIQAGMDLTGSGHPDLDGGRIFYVGHSMGADYGTILTAIEPEIRAAVLNSGGGTVVDLVRWGTNPLALAMLGLRQPPLINLPGPAIDAAWPLRDQPVRVIDVPGAVAIQECMERIEWNMLAGDPLAYAPHFRSSALVNPAPRRVLFQIALGDRSELNPVESNEIRAAGLLKMTSLYRHDLAFASAPTLPLDPHQFTFPVYAASDVQKLIARAAQRQITDFLSGDSLTAPPDVNYIVRLLFGRDLFEVPQAPPNGFNFVGNPTN